LDLKKFLKEGSDVIKAVKADASKQVDLIEERKKLIESIETLKALYEIKNAEFKELEIEIESTKIRLPRAQAEKDWDDKYQIRDLTEHYEKLLENVRTLEQEVRSLEEKKERLRVELKESEIFRTDQLHNIENADFQEFDEIIQAISNFKPEKIRDEDHLKAQLVAVLRTKFPEKKVEREIGLIQNHGVVDIVVNSKYAFEVKVPQDRTSLRDLISQLDEYKEEFPMICAIIFDSQESNLTKVILEYAEKYKQKLMIPTIILRGSKRFS